VYAYKHSLMQQVCYETLLARTRREYHRKIAAYLETRYGGSDADAASALPLIARHAFLGQDWPRALKYQALAGQQAQALFANATAIEHFTQALQCAERLPPAETAKHRLAIHVALGELLTTTGQYDSAQEHLNRARGLALERGDVNTQAHASRWLARLHELRGEYTPALDWVQRTLEVLAGQETSEAAEALLTAGLIHTRQGRLDRALEHCQDALRIAEKLGAITASARANNLLGHIAVSHGQSTAAITHFQQAFAFYQQTGDINGQAITHNQIARAFFGLSRWPEAEQHYRQARVLFEQMGDVYNRAFADNNLAEILLKRGDLDEALSFYQAALHAMEQIGGSAYVLGALHNNLGAAFIRRGELETAGEHLLTSQRYFEQAQARDFLPEMHRHLARIALLKGEVDEADQQAQQALSLARELDMRGEEGIARRVLGEIAVEQGRFEQSEAILAESVAILEELADEYELSQSRLALARAYAALGKREAALAALDRSLAVFERLEAAIDLTAARALRQQLA